MTEEQKRFQEAWQYHIRQLQTLALQADVSHEDWMMLRDKLYSWIDVTRTMKGEAS